MVCMCVGGGMVCMCVGVRVWVEEWCVRVWSVEEWCVGCESGWRNGVWEWSVEECVISIHAGVWVQLLLSCECGVEYM